MTNDLDAVLARFSPRAQQYLTERNARIDPDLAGDQIPTGLVLEVDELEHAFPAAHSLIVHECFEETEYGSAQSSWKTFVHVTRDRLQDAQRAVT